MPKKMYSSDVVPWSGSIVFRFCIEGQGTKSEYSYFSMKRYINSNISGSWAYSNTRSIMDNNFKEKEVCYVAFQDRQDASQFKLVYGDRTQQIRIWPSGHHYFVCEHTTDETSNNEVV